MSHRINRDVGFYGGNEGLQARVTVDHKKDTVAVDYKITLGEREDGLYGVKEAKLDGGFIEDEYYKNNPIGGPENTQSPEEYFADNGIDINEVNQTAEKYIQDKANPNDFTFKEIKEDLKQGVREYFKGSEGESVSTLKTKKFKEKALTSFNSSDKISTVMIDIESTKALNDVFNKEFKKCKKSAINKEAYKSLSM
ncbi:hypothetical protein [Vreelandella neptunia]|uniref:Lipoprotein n=1 Tax=Vreelandella neptunia TaxID=115551 RepID=A0ABS9SAJ7_9GAMM|nr:hypothetical protein [Halomonas neptunia]MCH4813129.1 hypothetical protein [Halomonas neptunia]